MEKKYTYKNHFAYNEKIEKMLQKQIGITREAFGKKHESEVCFLCKKPSTLFDYEWWCSECYVEEILGK